MRSPATESIAYKLMGVYAFIQAISIWSSIGNIYSFRNYSVWVGTAFYVMLVGWISSIVALFILGAILIMKSQRIARLSLPKTEAEAISSYTELDIMSMAFSILGVYLFTSAFPGLVLMFANTIPGAIRQNGFSMDHLWTQILTYSWPILLGHVVFCALGVWLFFGGPALAKFWKDRQTAAIDRSEAEPLDE